MECTLIDHYDYKTHDLFVGRVEKIYAEENILSNGTIDIAKVRPMLFDMHQRKYWKLGIPFADAWKIGKNYKN
jgi:flavin reductase (DIM6/NTAB) family NADH-FMN oxidoreductase RutF